MLAEAPDADLERAWSAQAEGHAIPLSLRDAPAAADKLNLSAIAPAIPLWLRAAQVNSDPGPSHSIKW
jgi:hypothetical protein